MNQTFVEMEMRGTRVSMKIGEQDIASQYSNDEQEELNKFHRMSLKQKRDYISKMESLKSGFMTPGMRIDDMLDRRIKDLDTKFKDINFG